ncbi:MAG: glycosyltransferase family 39 protein [Bdellovibrionota bacterium]
MKKFVVSILIVVLCAIAAIYGTGYSYDRVITPKTSHGIFKNIQGDGWIESRSEIYLRGLATRGNRATFLFNNWRPAGVPAAHIKVLVCNSEAADFLVDAEDKEITFSLNGDCEPRKITFEIVNPFLSSPSDQRKLGAQIKKLTISSKFWPPIVDPVKILIVFLGLVLLSRVICLALSNTSAQSASFLVPVLSLLLLSSSTAQDFDNLTALWLFFLLLSLGFYLGKLFNLKKLHAASDKTGVLISLTAILIVVIAGLIRFYGIKYGLPSNYHPDEVPKVNAIMRMRAQGDLNPDYFLHPSMLLYTSYAMNKFLHFFGIVEGDFRSTAFIAGRSVSALTGTFSVGLVFLIARRLFNSNIALLSAAMLAVFPLHVVCSRYMKEDAQLVFWILLTTWLVVKAVQDDKPWLYVLSGLTAGISASVKYSGLLSALIVACGPWLKSGSIKPDWRWFKWGVFAGILFPLGFVICTPYAILNNAKFIKDFSSEQHHMQRGHTITIDSWSQYWMYHFSKSLLPGMSWLPAGLGIIGLAILLASGSPAGLFIVALTLLFYLPAEYVKAKPAPQPERYILPSLPFLAICAGYLIDCLKRTKLKLGACLLVVLVVALPLYKTVNFSSEITNDTRLQMENWMLKNIPRGSKVYLDWRRYAPEFWNNEFEVTYIQRAKIMPRLDIRDLKASGQEYLVLSSLFYERYFSQPHSDPAVRQRLRDVFRGVPIILEMRPKHGTYGFHNPTLTLFSLKKDDFNKLEKELKQKERGEIQYTSNELKTSFPWFVD